MQAVYDSYDVRTRNSSSVAVPEDEFLKPTPKALSAFNPNFLHIHHICVYIPYNKFEIDPHSPSRALYDPEQMKYNLRNTYWYIHTYIRQTTFTPPLSYSGISRTTYTPGTCTPSALYIKACFFCTIEGVAVNHNQFLLFWNSACRL